METKRILHIHVKKKYWELARLGIKEEEYRLIKPYWTTRLQKKYDLIYYYLGYTNKKLIFKYDGKKIKNILHLEFGDKPVKVYAISLRKKLRS